VHGLGVRVGPLHCDFQADAALRIFGFKGDDLIVDQFDLLGGVQVLDVVQQAVLVQVVHGAWLDYLVLNFLFDLGLRLCIVLGTLIGEGDAQALVQEGHLLEAGAQCLEVELDGLEDLRIRVERLAGAGSIGFFALGQLLGRVPTVAEANAPSVALAAHDGVDLLGQCVHYGDAHAVQAAGDLVAASAELAAGVQDGHDNLYGWLALGWVDIHWDAAAIVLATHAAVGLQGDIDGVAVPSQRLIDGVVDNFVDQVVQAAGAGGTDVHARTLAYRFKPFEDGNILGAVSVFDFRSHRFRCGLAFSRFLR